MLMRLKLWLFNKLYQSISGMGRDGDTELAHINEWEANLLKKYGGSGTINPYTGLKEFKGGGGGSSTTKQELDPVVKPYVSDALEKAKQMQEGNVPQYYQGQTWVDPSAYTNEAMNMAYNRATNGSPLVTNAQDQMNKAIQGDYLNAGNPYLAQATQAGADVATDQFNNAIQNATSSASSMGRYGSNAHQRLMSDASDNLARNLSNQSGTMAYNNYNAERQNQLNAMYQAPQMAQADYYDAQQLQNLGQIQEGYDEQALQGDINRWDYGQNAERNALNQYVSQVWGAPMPTSSSTTQSGGGK